MKKILLLTLFVTIYIYPQLQPKRDLFTTIVGKEKKKYTDFIDSQNIEDTETPFTLQEGEVFDTKLIKAYKEDLAKKKEIARRLEEKRIKEEINNLNGKFYWYAKKLDSLGLQKDVKEYLHCINRMSALDTFKNTASYRIKHQNMLFEKAKIGSAKLNYFIKKQIAILESLFISKKKYFNLNEIERYNNYETTIKHLEDKVKINNKIHERSQQ